MASARRMIRASLSGLWPDELIGQVMFETRASATHLRSWIFQRAKYRGQRNLKVNVGCGYNIVAGWINMDLEGRPGVFRWDCRRGMPFDDESVESIFAEHVFEHLCAAAGSRFLAECRRCLRSAGLIRIVVPDVGRYLNLYQGGWSDFVPVRPLIAENDGYRDFWLDRVYRTKMEFINEVFRQGSEHKYAYDADTLMMKLKDAGFSHVIQQSYGVSVSGERPLDTEERGSESLYVEAIK
jgi:predicted SAM-dependent methyltransferase